MCYEVPPGAVRQCANGHCVCAECWDKLALDPRTCPECRVAMPEPIRSRAQEVRIRDFEAQGYAPARTTRLADAQLANARQRAENELLQSENERLRARVKSLEEEGRRVRPRTRPETLVEEAPGNEEVAHMNVRRAVGALTMYRTVERVAAVACVRINSLTYHHGAQVARDAAEAGAIEAAAAAMRTHPQSETVQLGGFGVLYNVCSDVEEDARGDGAVALQQRAVDAGALEATVAAMVAHPESENVQRLGCGMVGKFCARVRAVVDGRAVEAVLGAMRSFPLAENVQLIGSCALADLCDDIAGEPSDARLARLRFATDAGTIERVVAAMNALPAADRVQAHGCRALYHLCHGADAERPARRLRATAAGARVAVSAAMVAFPAMEVINQLATRLVEWLPVRASPRRAARGPA